MLLECLHSLIVLNFSITLVVEVPWIAALKCCKSYWNGSYNWSSVATTSKSGSTTTQVVVIKVNNKLGLELIAVNVSDRF